MVPPTPIVGMGLPQILYALLEPGEIFPYMMELMSYLNDIKYPAPG